MKRVSTHVASKREHKKKHKWRRVKRRIQLDTSTVDQGGAQRACGGANFMMRSQKRRQLFCTPVKTARKHQAGIDPESDSHQHNNAKHCRRPCEATCEAQAAGCNVVGNVGPRGVRLSSLVVSHERQRQKKQNAQFTTVKNTVLCGWHRLKSGQRK